MSKTGDIADVLVAGGGCAALCGAIAARRAGATVRMVEHAPAALRGGNARHARNFRIMHDQPEWYVPDVYGEEAFLKDLVRVTGGATDERLARILIRSSATIAPWLVENGVRLQDPASGAMPYSRRTAFFLGGGKAMVNTLYTTAQKLGVGVDYDSEVVALGFDDKNCTADIRHDGRIERVVAKTLIVCSGGHQANLGWLRESFGPAADNFAIRGTPYDTGSMLRLLFDAGAKPAGSEKHAHIVAVDARGPKFDGGIVTRITAIPHGIVVDRSAKRFHDEGEDARKTHFARWGARIAECEGQIAWLILDANGLARALPTALAPIRADTIADLATSLDLDPVALEATVSEFNAAISDEGLTTGLTPPKSRGAVALITPPFVAYPLRPGVTFTHYGVAVDDRLRVMQNDGTPIGNVFAAGMVMAANVLGDGYLAGLGVSLSAVFGRLAGEEAARQALTSA